MISARALEAVSADELSKAALLFSEMKTLRMKLSKDVKEEVLDSAFESHVHQVLEKLEDRLPSLNNETMKTYEIALAKHGLYDASFLQAITLCQAISPVLGDSVKELRLANFSFLMSLQESIQRSVDAESMHQKEAEHLQELASDLESRFGSLEIEFEDSQRSNKLLEQRIAELEAAATAAAEAHEQALASYALKAQVPPKKVFGHTITGKNENNNTANISSNQANSPNKPTASGTNTTSATISSAINNNTTLNNNNINNSKPSTSSSAASKSGSMSPSASRSTRDAYSIALPLTSAQKLSIFRSDIQKAIDDQRCRYITLNETCEWIEKMYESKIICNEKARSGVGGIPIETMEQHVYRHMEKRYGLRALAIEHSGNFIFALQRFQFQNNDVSTFYKIFCNVVEEDYQLTMKELRRSIRDLLMVQVMTRHPTKDQSVVNQLLDNKMNSSITEDEWVDMMNYLYNETDSASICLILKKLARDEMEQEEMKRSSDSKSPLSVLMRNVTNPTPNADQHQITPSYDTVFSSRLGGSASRAKVGFASTTYTMSSRSVVKDPTRSEFSANNANQFRLRFTTFQKAVLDFQLKSHEEYLESFRSWFHRLDDNADGVLDTALFYQCFSAVYSQMYKNNNNSNNSLGGQSRTPGGGGGQDTSLNVFNKLTISSNNNNNNNNEDSSSSKDSEEMLELFGLVVQAIDPLERDVIVYSEAVSSLIRFGNNK